MKKVISTILTAALILAATGCGGGAGGKCITGKCRYGNSVRGDRRNGILDIAMNHIERMPLY